MDWYRKAYYTLTGGNAINKAHELSQAYGAPILQPVMFEPEVGEEYQIELWVNLNTIGYVITIFPINIKESGNI